MGDFQVLRFVECNSTLGCWIIIPLLFMCLFYNTLIIVFTSRHNLYSNTSRYGLGSRRSSPCTHTRTYVFITTSEPALKRPSHLILYFRNKLAQGDAANSSPQITEYRAPACPLHLFSFMTQCLSTGTTLSFFCRERRKPRKTSVPGHISNGAPPQWEITRNRLEGWNSGLCRYSFSLCMWNVPTLIEILLHELPH